jgi:hypothetical protein
MVASPRAPLTPDEQARRREASKHADRALVALLFFVALAIGGYFVARKIGDNSRMQDCIQSGRRNCAPIDTQDLKQ